MERNRSSHRLRHGLNADIHQLMVVYDDEIGIENFIQKNIRVSQRLSACSPHQSTLHPPPAATSVALPAPEPMQLNSNHLTLAERQRRINNHLRLYFGGEGHVLQR